MSGRGDSNDECRTETTTTMENSQENQESQAFMVNTVVDMIIANKDTIAFATGVTVALIAPPLILDLVQLVGFGLNGVTRDSLAAKVAPLYKGLIPSGSPYSIGQSVGVVGLPVPVSLLSSTLGGYAVWATIRKLLRELEANNSASRVKTKVRTTDPSFESSVAANKDAFATNSLAEAWQAIRVASLSAADTGLTYTREGLARVTEWSSERASSEDKTETTTQSSSEPVISNRDASPAGAVVAALYSIGAVSPLASDKGRVPTLDAIAGVANTWLLIQKYGGLKVEPLDSPSESPQSKP